MFIATNPVSCILVGTNVHEEFINRNFLEKFAKENSVKILLIDGYRNARMTEKLQLSELPAMVEIASGKVVKVTKVNSEADVA